MDGLARGSSPCDVPPPARTPGGLRRARWIALVGTLAIVGGCGNSTPTPDVTPSAAHGVAQAPNGTAALAAAPSAIAPAPSAIAPSPTAVAPAATEEVPGLRIPLRNAPLLASIQVGSSSALIPGTSDGKRLWVLTDNGPVAIDPATNKVTLRIPLEPSSDGYGIAAGNGSLWVSAYDAGTVSRYDARTGKLQATIPVDNASCVMAAAGMVWACEHLRGRVVRIDPKRNAIVSSVNVGTPGDSGPGEIDWANDRLWVQVGNDRSVVSVDPTSGKTMTVQLSPNTPGPIAVRDGMIWVTDWQPSGLLMVDPSGKVLPRLTHVDGETSQALIEPGSVWAGFLPRSNTTIGALIGVDPGTGDIVDGLRIPEGQVTQVSEAFGSVWLVLGNQGIVERLASSTLTLNH